MRAFAFSVLFFVLIAAGGAQGAETAVPATAETSPAAAQRLAAAPTPLPPAAPPAAADEYGDIEDPAEVNGAGTNGEAKGEIADPLEPFNRAMYHFNDRLYFWVLKPVAQGYGQVVPKPARVGVSNFFANLAFPVRFVNSLLQANVTGALEELARFTINTLWGIGGLLDPAASEEIALKRHNEDLGQTLGVYGMGPGFFINWPFFGPSSPRDTVGLIGDGFLSPLAYLNPWYTGAGIKLYDRVNDTSLTIGDYESLKGAAIDPYIALRNAYVQYRLQKIQRRGGESGANSRLPQQ